MALLTILTIVSVLGLYTLYKYITSAKQNQIPKGLKKLPGPKGMNSPIVLILLEHYMWEYVTSKSTLLMLQNYRLPRARLRTGCPGEK